MILLLFGVLLVISLFLVILSYVSNEGVYGIIGFIFLFFLSVFVIMPGNLEYKTGVEETYIYGTNLTGYHYEDYNESAPTFKELDPPLLFHKEIVNTYSSFDDSTSRWFGRWLAIISVIGLVICLIESTGRARLFNIK